MDKTGTGDALVEEAITVTVVAGADTGEVAEEVEFVTTDTTHSSGQSWWRNYCCCSSALGGLVAGSSLAILLSLGRATVMSWLPWWRRWSREGGNGMRSTGRAKFAVEGHCGVTFGGFKVKRSIFSKIPDSYKFSQRCNHKLRVYSWVCHLH